MEPDTVVPEISKTVVEKLTRAGVDFQNKLETIQSNSEIWSKFQDYMASFGVTISDSTAHVWDVLILQARVIAIYQFIPFISSSILAFYTTTVFMNQLNKTKQTPSDNNIGFLFLSFASVFLFSILSFNSYKLEMITGLVNPEFWVYTKIFEFIQQL